MRLLSPDTCPSNATRDSCPCVKDNSPRVGMSVWTKINLNITSLSINRKVNKIKGWLFKTDHFCLQHMTSHLPDRFMGQWCPMGRRVTATAWLTVPRVRSLRIRNMIYSFHDVGKFSINLTGTGLRVADHSSWIGVGNKPSVWLQRIQVW